MWLAICSIVIVSMVLADHYLPKLIQFLAFMMACIIAFYYAPWVAVAGVAVSVLIWLVARGHENRTALKRFKEQSDCDEQQV